MSTRTAGAPPALATTTGAYPKRWAAAIIMIIAALMDMIDGSIVNTALPSIGRGLHADSAQLQWTVSAYMLGFAAALIIAGHLGDRYGRKNLFLGGTALFALASLAGAVADSPGTLIGARAVQGVSAAVLMPQVLASFRTMFDEKERGKVFAVYGAMAGLAVSAGIVLGGVLTDWNLFGWGWRTIFAVNIPVALLVLALGAKWIPAMQERARGRIDLLGSLVLAGALVAIVLPLVQGRDNGWPLWGWLLLAAGVVALLGLTVFESRRGVEHPLLPAALFRKAAFSGGLLIQLVFYGSMTGFALAFTIWLQAGQQYSATQAGVVMVASSAGAIISAPMVDGLVAKYGRKTLIVGGLIIACGYFWVHYATQHSAAHHTGAWPLVPGLVLSGTGMGLIIIPLVNIVLSAVPEHLAGGASGIFSTAQQFGGALGAAVIGNVFFSHLSRGMTAAIDQAGLWTVGAFLLCTALCFTLPRRPIASHADGH
ncbi:MFS transporter [Streptomyces sp. GbtcB6]|uniref:MFS transporter n=1 Tax=Streptomyces sp. GbtcB6 TaxID=2824751 RepID=UPI001C306DF2|nr:MFS transporter [Streptomyces sp. GbtcB6]